MCTPLSLYVTVIQIVLILAFMGFGPNLLECTDKGENEL